MDSYPAAVCPVPVIRAPRSFTASDWLDDVVVGEDPAGMDQRMVAEAGVWYSRLPEAVRRDRSEFAAQAQGVAERLASSYGSHADEARRVFLDHVVFQQRRSGREVGADLASLPSLNNAEALNTAGLGDERAPFLRYVAERLLRQALDR